MTSSTWNIDVGHSSINFSVRHLVIAKVRGQFRDWKGQLSFDPERPEATHVEIEIGAASIDTGVAERDQHLRSPDFLDAERFPALRFQSQRIESTGEGTARLHGQLTIRDVTREVAIEVEHRGTTQDPWGNRRSGFSGATSLLRKDFGLTWNQALETGGVLVGDRIDIELDVEAVEQSAAKAAE
jgi:polyisoprenoid-binding protein YceI